MKNMHNKFKMFVALPMLAVMVSGCGNLTPYRGPDSVLALPLDKGFADRGVLQAGDAAVVYDPDGCQGWLIDDGIEGYSGRRFDPVSGLPICNNLYPPGTVIGNPQTDGRRLSSDWVKG